VLHEPARRGAPVTEPVDAVARTGYLRTLEHLLDTELGHFSQDHPDISGREGGDKGLTPDQARQSITSAATGRALQPGDLIWVEWDVDKKRIVSFGWHYYYRWAYTDTVLRQQWQELRPECAPLQEEKGDRPGRLSLARRLFGYASGAGNTAEIGKGQFAQLMGRVFPNSAMEVVAPGEDPTARFLPPVYLKELGQPKASAVECYLRQPHVPEERRPSDAASLVTYGDAPGYDDAGSLAGRKFYLDRSSSASPQTWEDRTPANLRNKRSALALNASQVGRRFRFTVRFRDLDADEVATLMLAIAPNQLAHLVAPEGGTAEAGYVSKLGMARPLGWGSVRAEVHGLFFIDQAAAQPELLPEPVETWFGQNAASSKLAGLAEWLAVHRHDHPDAADYLPFAEHAALRADHALKRRLRGART
jgi:CRISPR-associated protein (TIGR03986 family)